MYQSGGCDYTIGCGQLLILLPESIQSMEEAIKYVTEDDGNGGEKGSLYYHGRDRVDKCVIHEIIDSFKVDMNAVQQTVEEERKMIKKERLREQLEAIKKELGE